MELDTSIHGGTLRPQKLLKNDGAIARQIVESVRPPNPGLAGQDRTFNGGARLPSRSGRSSSANAIRATDSMDTIDWCSSNNSTPCALQAISIPLLVTAMGGHYFIRDNEIHYEFAKSKDKDFVIIEGATHGQMPCVPCEISGTVLQHRQKTSSITVRNWINERF